MRCIIDHPIQPYFPHIAVAPWPKLSGPSLQIDWVDSVLELESWLERFVGPHYSRWAYATTQEQEYWQACVAFALARDRTMFVLKWSS